MTDAPVSLQKNKMHAQARELQWPRRHGWQRPPGFQPLPHRPSAAAMLRPTQTGAPPRSGALAWTAGEEAV